MYWLDALQDLVNAATWNILSHESQATLQSLLPPTAFEDFRPGIEPDHPSCSSNSDPDAMAVDSPNIGSSSNLDISVFTDPHLLAAAHTLQDHIYTDWMSDCHIEKVQKYEMGVRDGTLSAAWKDDVWERNNAGGSAIPTTNGVETVTSPWSAVRESSARAGWVHHSWRSSYSVLLRPS